MVLRLIEAKWLITAVSLDFHLHGYLPQECLHYGFCCGMRKSKPLHSLDYTHFPRSIREVLREGRGDSEEETSVVGLLWLWFSSWLLLGPEPHSRQVTTPHHLSSQMPRKPLLRLDRARSS